MSCFINPSRVISRSRHSHSTSEFTLFASVVIVVDATAAGYGANRTYALSYAILYLLLALDAGFIYQPQYEDLQNFCQLV